MSVIKDFCKRLAGPLIGEYSPYFIYRWTAGSEANGHDAGEDFLVRPVEAPQLVAADSLMHAQADYLGEESFAFGCFIDSQMVGVCFYWFGERYKRRGFWPLAQGEAKLVQIIVLPAFRGRGVAKELIVASGRAMVNAGFSSLYARVWHSNVSSLRAFEKAGWLRTAFVLEFNPFRARKPIRIQWNLIKRAG